MTRERGGSEDRGRAQADSLTSLERRARRLLLVYPAAYRRDRGEEIIGTLLETTPEGRAWPRLRDARALAIGSLRARAAQNRQRTVGANLRVAVMTGLAMYLSYWFAAYLDSVVQWFVPSSFALHGGASWAAPATALLIGATVALAWSGPRAAALAAAAGASAGVVAFALAVGGPAAMLGPRVLQLLALAGLVALAPRTGHPSRHWLWLPGVIAISSLLVELGVGVGWLGLGLLTPAIPLIVMIVGGILWVGIDARLFVAVLTYFAVTAMQMPVTMISAGLAVFATLPVLLVVVAIAAPAVWLLRRQSARPAPS